LIAARRVVALCVPDGSGILMNLAGRQGALFRSSATKFGGAAGGMGMLCAGAANEGYHTGNTGSVAWPGITEFGATVFGVLSFTSIGTNETFLSLGSDDARFEYRWRVDSTTGLNLCWVDGGYAVDPNDTISMGVVPPLHSPIAFVSRMQQNAYGGDRLFVDSMGNVAGAPVSNQYYGLSAGAWDLGAASNSGNSFNGAIYLVGYTDVLWTREQIHAFFADPYELVREVPRKIYPLPASSGSSPSVNLTGQSSATALGTLSVTLTQNLSLTGQSSATALGTLSVTLTQNLSLTGQSSTTALGTLSVIAGTIVFPMVGLAAVGQVGTITVTRSLAWVEQTPTAGSWVRQNPTSGSWVQQ
jgi:hypothetical protein